MPETVPIYGADLKNMISLLRIYSCHLSLDLTIYVGLKSLNGEENGLLCRRKVSLGRYEESDSKPHNIFIEVKWKTKSQQWRLSCTIVQQKDNTMLSVQ